MLVLSLLATVVHHGGLLKHDLGWLAFDICSITRLCIHSRTLVLLPLTLALGTLLSCSLFQVGGDPERFHFLGASCRFPTAVHAIGKAAYPD